MKNLSKKLPIFAVILLMCLPIYGQEKVSMEFGSNVLGYKSQFQNQELFIRGMYEFPTDYVGNWQLGVGAKLSSNIDGFDNVSEIIIYNGYNFKGLFTDEKLGVSVNASFNLNSFSLLFVTSLGVQLQVSYEIFDGVSLFANVDNVSHLERDELYPDTLIRNMLKQNISIYGGVKIYVFDTRY
jgi:hypothetical protein